MVKKSKPQAIICDMDGTLALMKGKRTPFEYNKCHRDEPNHIIIAAVLSMKKMYNCKLIIVSAREQIVYDKDVCVLDGKYMNSTDDRTIWWLNNWLGKDNWDKLFLRETGNHRKDRYVKYDLYKEKIYPHYEVICVYDDRDQVVEMWRHGANLTCFQVADGKF